MSSQSKQEKCVLVIGRGQEDKWKSHGVKMKSKQSQNTSAHIFLKDTLHPNLSVSSASLLRTLFCGIELFKTSGILWETGGLKINRSHRDSTVHLQHLLFGLWQSSCWGALVTVPGLILIRWGHLDNIVFGQKFLFVCFLLLTVYYFHSKWFYFQLFYSEPCFALYVLC